VQARRHAQAVLDPDIEGVAFVENEAVGAGGLHHAVACRGLAGDLDLPRLETQHLARPGRLLCLRSERHGGGEGGGSRQQRSAIDGHG
jgi:hypothetical protein